MTSHALFAAALRDPQAALPSQITAPPGASLERRFTVYRDNHRESLIGALAAVFPACEAIVGRPFFAGMAAAFLAQFPPRSPLLLAYGAAFPDFAAAFPPARGLDYLADVMRIEWARAQAYHAADSQPLTLAELAALPPAALLDLVLVPHPAATLLGSPHPALTVWEMNAGRRPLGPITARGAATGEDCLVTRPELDVLTVRLLPGARPFLTDLLAGEALAAAAETATARAPAFDPLATLTTAVTAGAFLSLSSRDDRP